MDFSIRHAIPGRLRLHLAAIYGCPQFAADLLAWAQKQVGVRTARINRDCASLVIEYDVAQRIAFGGLLVQLRSLSSDQIQALAGHQAEGDGQALQLARRRQQPLAKKPHRYPMLWPSLSLLLSFSRNPFVVGVNAPLLLWNAFPIYKRAWMVWSRESRLNIDFLDALAIAASIGQGAQVAGAVIVWLIHLGDWIRDLTAAGSKRAVKDLLQFQEKTAWLVKDGEVVAVPTEQLTAGDALMVYPGEIVPVDGEILEGRGLLDQKTITGEGLPVTRGKGEAVFAASILREGQLTVRALRCGGQTMAGQIAQLVDSAPIGDTRMQNHAERFADRLVLPTLALAVGTAGVTADFNRFLSLVIVDFGTGIRVAAPTSMLSSMTQAARAGIIVKSGGHMEKLAEVDTVIFDKTGTLSHGTPHVVETISYSRHKSADELLALAVAAETRLNHPVAEALRAKARERSLQIPHCEETDYKVGLGVQGQVNGNYVHVGSERFLRQSDIKVDQVAGDRAACDHRGLSCLYVAVDGQLAGIIAYEDQIRPESRSVIQSLHRMGIRDTIMLTGDNTAVARAVGRRLGLTRQIAEMMPTDKAKVVQELQREGRKVAMVGDGINDSPALTYADVGIAMKHGAEIAHESAHVVLMEDSLWKLVKAVEISRNSVSLIKQNYGIVAVLNGVALALALPGGLVTPEVTAVISNGSAILASLNGMRPLLRDRA
jgi:heavy metal translocating P-type ATPase